MSIALLSWLVGIFLPVCPARAGDVREDCPGEIAPYIEQVRERASRSAYLCLARRDDAEPALLKAIAEGTDASSSRVPGKASVTRALAIHLIFRLDRALTAEEVRALSPADVRLVRDAVYARRGRRSPAPDHDKVFSQFAWYAPDDGYTDARLTDLDRANLAMLDHPPKPDAGEPAAAAMPGNASVTRGVCGCAATPMRSGSAMLALAALAALLRRRR